MIKVVLLSVSNLERSTAEHIENSPEIVNLETLIDSINEKEGSEIVNKANSDELIQIYPIADFTTACNDQIIDLESWWITYVNFYDKDDKLFTVKDMRNAFIAGEEFESDTINVELGEEDEITMPDFGEWMEQNYNVKID